VKKTRNFESAEAEMMKLLEPSSLYR